MSPVCQNCKFIFYTCYVFSLPSLLLPHFSPLFNVLYIYLFIHNKQQVMSDGLKSTRKQDLFTCSQQTTAGSVEKKKERTNI